MAVERTFVMIKPDGVQRGLVGEIIHRIERRGIKLVAMKFMNATDDILNRHYAEHIGKGFFAGLLEYIKSGPVVAMVWEGDNAIETIRTTMGKTKAHEADPGTIRGDFALHVSRNLVHGSDGGDSAAREIAIWFTPAELVEYTRAVDGWIHE
jgi:nucleoside-diphosphate kinase